MMNPRVLSISDTNELTEEFRKIGVDWGGVPIMRAKGILKLIKLHQIPVFWANILKQEMLSLGGDAAVSRGSLTGQLKFTDCLLLATLSQYQHLVIKLKKQPLGLAKLGLQIQEVLICSSAGRSVLDIDGKKRRLGGRTLVMGIINVTPDSFSGDGILRSPLDQGQKAFDLARFLIKGGADILDVGGVSSRPGARRISAKEEIRRVGPVLKVFKKKLGVPLSIDTDRSEVAHMALDLGAAIVNDVSALRSDKKMAGLVSRYKASVVLMHRQGTPQTMQQSPHYEDVMGEIASFFSVAIERAEEAGIAKDKIILDPGIGFGKTLEHNTQILKRLAEFKSFGRPILVGVSRKAFIGRILKAEVGRRIWGTAAAVAAAVFSGADIVRVHDVSEMKQVVRMADALSG